VGGQHYASADLRPEKRPVLIVQPEGLYDQGSSPPWSIEENAGFSSLPARCRTAIHRARGPQPNQYTHCSAPVLAAGIVAGVIKYGGSVMYLR